ncbi:hypothetical protein ACGFIE_07640 [Micromonospora sp. NPDC049275]|uniref:hypothetical protein n=1 Tax=Micromonospora sp. NPDC049275 TaxID=3364268 RepID=UPI003715D101
MSELPGVTDDAILDAAFAPALSLVTGIPDDLHPEWLPVVTAPTAEERIAAALARWTPDFTDLLPQFFGEFRTRLLDVRLGRAAGELALIYVVRGRDDELVLWMGWDPRRFREPRFWNRFPAAARTFLQTVHAGFSHPDGVSGGLAHVGEMSTYAEWAEEPDGLADWDEEQEIASTRLLVVTSNGTNLLYCLSPDLPTGTIALVYEGDIDPQPFAASIDALMVRPLEN